MKHNKLFKAGQPMIFPHAQLQMFPTWPQFHLPLFFFDWTLCNATSIFFTYSKTFSRQPDSHWKNPDHQKLLREDAIVLYHVKKQRNIRKSPERVMSTKSFPYILCVWKGRWEVPVFWQHMLYPQQSNTLILILKQIGRSAKKKKKKWQTQFNI